MSDCITDSDGYCICDDPLHQRIAALEAEVARLQEALIAQIERIFTDYGACYCPSGPFSGHHVRCCVMAKAALAAPSFTVPPNSKPSGAENPASFAAPDAEDE